jgi:peptidoglycan/xylan/chitin deacetylase (PgdA/CDA1 family)
MNDQSLPILTFHALDMSRAPTSTDPSRFVEIIAHLVESGFVGVDLATWVARGRPRIVKGFAVTFDDGLRSILDGVSVLKRYAVPATIFLVSGRVGLDNDWPGQPSWVPRAPTLDRSEIADLARLGFSFGSHTETHARLDRLRTDDVKQELRSSRDAVEEMSGRSCRLMAYPEGVSSLLVRERAEWYYDAALGTRQARASVEHDPFDLPRIDACYLRSPAVVGRLIAGRLDPWLSIRRTLRAVRRVAASLGPVGA